MSDDIQNVLGTDDMGDGMNDNPTEKSLNRQIAEALGWRFIPDPRLDDRDSFQGVSPDGKTYQLADNGHSSNQRQRDPLDRLIPDYEHDLKVTLAALHLRERHMQAMLRYSVHAQRTECMLLRLGGGLDTYFFTAYGDAADDLDRAAARALLVLLRRERE